MPYTLSAPVESRLEIKKSVFLGLVAPVLDRPAAQALVETLRARHPDAAHVCWALLAGGHSAAVDDGEPGGTAGRPMLDVLRHQDLDGVVAAVVRYYGGVKLGAGGLVRAYTDTVAQALLSADKVPVRRNVILVAEVPYALEGTLRRLIQQAGAQLETVAHADSVTLAFTLPADDAAAFQAAARDACHGALRWLGPSDEA
ncbi:IMPACT family protein [Chitiniphilus eburneus]|uniref:YigZ family protein n=1 Tax=Chitiniphilus eburneus TaxID=2571148 RepID=A0A4U0PHU4_9NEIS|nr:YigZ family protein [Chitiniphilus eburneus]TJZ67457.1 YigZ family protein [Chitiniphilus eburneus]